MLSAAGQLDSQVLGYLLQVSCDLVELQQNLSMSFSSLNKRISHEVLLQPCQVQHLQLLGDSSTKVTRIQE